MSTRRRIVTDVVGAIVVAALFTAGVRIGAEWLEATVLAGFSHAPFEVFANALQTALILIFAVILGAFIHRYPEPFYIFWYCGWLSWLGLYSTRFLGEPIGQVFNAFNSFFFLAAAIDLTAPSSWNLIRDYPPRPAKQFGSPLMWLGRYFRRNPLMLVLMIPVLLIASLERIAPLGHVYAEGLFSVSSIALLGFGLYQRMVLLSPQSGFAFATLAVHAVYLEPQIAKMLWPSIDTHEFDYLLTVVAPSLILKPTLALFVTLFALRETDARREEAEARGVRMLQSLPDACILVKNGEVDLANTRANELLGLALERSKTLESMFCSRYQFETFMNALRTSPAGRVIGHDTEISVAGIEPEYAACISVRLDAFYVSRVGTSLDEEIIILILDRHELQLANAVYSVAHDYVQPRLRDLSGRLNQLFLQSPSASASTSLSAGGYAGGVELGLCRELLDVMDLLRSESRGFWHRSDGGEERASVQRSMQIAWAQARYACAVEFDCTPEQESTPDPIDHRVEVRLSEGALNLALQNAYKNAIQHTYKREKRNHISAVETAVTITDRWVVIRISDSGKGFNEAIMRFMNDSKGGGSSDIGMGLVTIKLTCARAGGAVRVGNRPDNAGGWIEIMLPAWPQAALS